MYAHLDIRNFFAACEQHLNPEYQGKPVVVYNESYSGSQAIIAASKEAKEKYGIGRDTFMGEARTIPDIIFVKSRLEIYKLISDELFLRCRDLVEKSGFSASKPYIDDLVIELTDDLSGTMELTREIEKLYHKEGFDVAIGISFGYAYASMATKMAKKYGLIYFGSGFAKKLVYRWPVIAFPQIGPVRREKLKKANIRTIGDIANSSLDEIMAILGDRVGMEIYCSVLGVEPNQDQLKLFENK